MSWQILFKEITGHLDTLTLTDLQRIRTELNITEYETSFGILSIRMPRQEEKNTMPTVTQES